MTYAAKLLPCPFCGSNATMESQFNREWWVQCDECNASHGVLGGTQANAAEIWNARAIPALAQPAESVLKSLLNKLDSRIGVHPLSVNGVPRTERQNGWNDCSTQVSAICDEVNQTIAQPVPPAAQEPEWVDDPHDIEQGMMRNPKWKPAIAIARLVPPADASGDLTVAYMSGFAEGKKVAQLGRPTFTERTT